MICDRLLHPNLKVVFGLSILSLALVHLIFLKYVPGFQMDEGLFGDIAHRLASGESIPFLDGMVNYTTWISSYPIALAFKLFGTSQVIYRATGALEVVLGISLISLSLFLLNEKKTAAFLPGIISFFPALVINHRWVIEETTFFLLCTGLVCLGLSLKKLNRLSWLSSVLIIFGISAGIHAHIIYLAPTLSLYLCLLAAGKITRLEDRLTVLCICIFQIPFFLKIARLESAATLQNATLFIADLCIILVSVFPKLLAPFSLTFRKRALAIPAAMGVILFAPLLLFLEGHWLAKFSVGFIDYPLFIGWSLVPAGITLFYLLRSGWKPRSWIALYFLPLALLFAYGMVIKAGGRHLEIMFLVVAVSLTWAMTQLPRKVAFCVAVLWMLQGSCVLGLNYFRPSIQERQIDSTFYFWRWRDGSGGFLPKVRLLKRLADEGCGYSNIDFRIPDNNTHHAFQLLKINDWPPFTPPCRLGKLVRIKALENFSSTGNAQIEKNIEGPYSFSDTSDSN